jgi:hypothetical protein
VRLYKGDNLMKNAEAEILQRNQQEYRERVAEQQERERTKTQHKTDNLEETPAHLKRVRNEIRQLPENNQVVSAEANLRNIERLNQSNVRGTEYGSYRNVQKIERRFESPDSIEDFKKEAWSKLENSHEGKMLIKQVGGKEKLIQYMSDYRGDFITKTASLCHDAGLNDSAIGRTVHRMAELYTLEKQPKDILEGVRQVEQRINFNDRRGVGHHVEIDDVTKRGDNTFIRDYKPINLSHFERTSAGREWVKFMEKNVGSNFRERIMAGESPYFQKETAGLMPKSIQHALRDYIRNVSKHHIEQLDNYKNLYSQATGIDRANIQTSVRPYFKFS